MTPVSPHWGHFLGLQRVSTWLPHFSQVKTAIASSSIHQCSFLAQEESPCQPLLSGKEFAWEAFFTKEYLRKADFWGDKGGKRLGFLFLGEDIPEIKIPSP